MRSVAATLALLISVACSSASAPVAQPSGSALATTAEITEYPIPTPGSDPQLISAGPDGNLWFTEQVGNKVAMVTTSGVFTEYTVPTANSSPSGIAAGPDGNLWFTEFNTSTVARMTTSGVITEYAVPTPGSDPQLIAAGPDGNLWFTEFNTSKVAKMTTSGVITEYPVPTSPSGIAAGPDGNIWFTEAAVNKVAKMTTLGAVTEYPVPTGGDRPELIVAGQDGNLWFTDYKTNKVTKVTTSGVFTEYTVPTANGAPLGITAGPDGNLWFGEVVGKVAKVTTSGVFTEYALPTANGASSPYGIVAGPDGNLWLIESSGNKVAKVVPAPSPSARPSRSASPVVSASPAELNLSCRLPVTWGVLNGQTVTPKAGFITFPKQKLQEDPSAPVGKSVFYDRGLSKWLPVWRESVSPDGKQYAYSQIEGNAYQNAGSKLHVVDVATGVDTVIYSGNIAFGVVDFAADGIYLTPAVPEGRPRGLWLESLAGDPPRLISSTVIAPAVGAGAAWGVDFNTADPSPGPGGLEGPMNRVLRIDLSSGAATPWFYRPGANIYTVGVDANGHPVVSADFAPSPTDPNGRDTAELWLVTSATSATRLFVGTGVPYPSRLVAIDSDGVWFDGAYGNGGGTVWLYAGGSLQTIATVNVNYFAVAGGCIP